MLKHGLANQDPLFCLQIFLKWHHPNLIAELHLFQPWDLPNLFLKITNQKSFYPPSIILLHPKQTLKFFLLE